MLHYIAKVARSLNVSEDWAARRIIIEKVEWYLVYLLYFVT